MSAPQGENEAKGKIYSNFQLSVMCRFLDISRSGYYAFVHITPSMSRRADPYGNAMAENFFSILKTECI